MSVSDGVEGADRPDVEGQKDIVLQIYQGLLQDTPACFQIQITPGATAAMVIQFAIDSLGLKPTGAYTLLEVRQAGGVARRLGGTEMPGERVLLWPPAARKYHSHEEGYYFILQSDGDAPSLEDCDDLCNLSPLTEDTILITLRRRFYKHKIYTYANGILVAINPFKFLPIYNPKYLTMYNKQPLGNLSPHIFAVADVAYHTMLKKQENQCVVISGESGSGKTQSTNFLIHCLTALSQKGCSSGVERTILGAGPVLEAFGNARTAQNNNSSRFGKFIQVNYLESGVVRGAVIEKYLLEKCRLVFRDKSERNYHVFYYLLVGASKEEQMEFHLLKPEEYAYLQQENLHLEDAEDLRHEFTKLHQAMEMVGFLPPTRNQIFSLLSAILYLGNVTYTQSEDGQRLKAGPEDVLSTLSYLLKVKKELLVNALTERKQKTVNDTLVLYYTLKEAITARDSMAKSLYNSLFDWIVLHINHALLNRRDMEESVSCLSIGILDIFGFEDFQTNSFEQFCINYANEKLHYYFNQHIFKLEQEEYVAEGICWRTIDYTDNLGCIQLISQKPTGLFHLLDEESNLPQATDDTLLGKFKKQHQNNPYFVPTPVMKPAFVIRHFAGMVQYQIQDFRKKNTDHMRPDIVALLRSSELAFMRQLIGSDPVAVFRWGILRATIRIIAAFNKLGRNRAAGLSKRMSSISAEGLRRQRSSVLKRKSSLWLDFSFDHSDDYPLEVFEDIFASYEIKKMNKTNKHKQLIPKNLVNSQSLKHIVGLTLHDSTTRSLLHPHQRKKPPSISAQFQTSLNKLLETVGRAEPFFIRCIRANAEKKEMLFDTALVLQQLRYTGMLETVRIRKSGYSAKFTFKEFLETFRVLLPKDATASPEDIAKLLQKLGLEHSTYQIGKTKVFLKERQRQSLQYTVNKEVMRRIILLQRWFRSCLVRNNFLSKKDAAIRIQRCWRSFQAGNRSRAAIVIQGAWRGSQKRTDYFRKRLSVQKLQDLVKNKPVQNHSKGEQNSTPPQLPTRPQTPPKPPPKPQTTPSPTLRAKLHTELQGSTDKGELRKQQGVDDSPNRSPASRRPTPGLELNGQHAAEPEKREGRGSPTSFSRPLSFPLDFKADGDEERNSTSLPPQGGTLERYSRLKNFKENAKKWKENRRDRGITGDSSPELQPHRDKRLEGGSPGDSSPELQPPRDKRLEGLLKAKGKSLSLDNLSTITSDSDNSTSNKVRVPSPRQAYHRRRLACTRSGLNFHADGSQESEYWNFPLPPMSPAPDVSGVGQSWQSAVDIFSHKPGVQTSSENVTDSGKFSHGANESPALNDSSQSQPPTPERVGFFSKILKKRSNKDPQPPEHGKRNFQTAHCDSGVTSPTSMNPYRSSSENNGMRRNPTIRISRATRVCEWNSSLERQITDTNELRHLDELLGNQVNELRSRKELSATENIFLSATMQFRETIKGMYSISKPQIGYRGLMTGYQTCVSNLAGAKQQSEVQTVVNLFQSILDGFIRGELKRIDAPPKVLKKSKVKEKKRKCPQSPLDHMFSNYQVNIMQSCDQCLSYIWVMEKAYMCSACKLTCHKKCFSKINTDCSTRCARLENGAHGHLQFGVPVSALSSKAHPVPLVVQMLLEHVEMNGLYTEGLYRKSGSACHARELHQLLESSPEMATLENYSIHTVTGLLKRWLRELPDPLMTYNLYNEFLQAVELPGQTERLHAIYKKLEELPAANFNTLERLLFHLVRVAKEEEHNRMSANSLAIVFAPCIMRSPDTTDPFLGMKDVSKTTTCVEILITEQFRRYTEKMQEILKLEFAESLAVSQLKLKRQNTILETSAEDMPGMDNLRLPATDRESERKLIERIKSIKEEKEELAYRLPALEQEYSDDNLDTESIMSSDSLQEEDRISGRMNMLRTSQWQQGSPTAADLAHITTSTGPGDQLGGQPNIRALSRQFSDLDIPFMDEEEV
ncbi:hypothetical protein UPYG_G00296380 [Umbra pygmaea]|uniref:Unconventional myosin-IXb-like n=1 Tax=Umbra pygmaea TaxID=75934 RepID=A0ABD0WP45_UMBPY